MGPYSGNAIVEDGRGFMNDKKSGGPILRARYQATNGTVDGIKKKKIVLNTFAPNPMGVSQGHPNKNQK
jgi:hypothetical protein